MDIADALLALLERIEEPQDHDHGRDRRVRGWAPVVPTGVDALDSVCDGLAPGEVTVVEADLPAHAAAVAHAVAVGVEVPVLLAAPDTGEATSALLAAAAGVPAVLMESGELSERDWYAISHSIGALAERPLAVAAPVTVKGLWHVVARERPTVLVVSDPGGLGEPEAVLRVLVDLADRLDVATLVTCGSLAGLPITQLAELRRVVMCAHALGSRATFAATGSDAPLATATVAVDLLPGRLV